MIKRVIHESPTGSFIAYRETTEEEERRRLDAASAPLTPTGMRWTQGNPPPMEPVPHEPATITLHPGDRVRIVGVCNVIVEPWPDAPKTPTAPPTEAEGAEG